MNKKYLQAKKQGLNWQALLIEETQTELKILIRDMVLQKKTFSEINKVVVKTIETAVNDLESDNLKEISTRSLLGFSTRIYWYYKNTFKDISIIQLVALNKVAQGIADYKEIQTTRKFVNEIVPLRAYETRVPLDVYAKDYIKMVEERLNYLAGIDAKDDYSERVSLRNIAEMQVRQERHQQEIQDIVDAGNDLVWIVPHANCSERCEPWQGKLYSISGRYGEIDGINFQPLSNATDIYETTKSGKVYKNGCISGFNCFDKETEVLTNNGWKLFKDLTENDLIYTLNDKKMTEWQKPLHYFKSRYCGNMVHLKSYTSDLLVTPNHNMLYYTNRVKKLRFKQAKDISLWDVQYCGQEWYEDDKTKSLVIGDNIIDFKLFCRLLGYYLGDGSIHDKTSIKIAQTNNDEMWKSLQELPFKLWRDKNKIIIRDKTLRNLFSKLGTCTEKFIFTWVKDLPKNCLRELLNAFNYTDGYITKPKKIGDYSRKPHKTLFTTSKQLCADLCEIALKCGYRPKVETKHCANTQQTFKNGTYTINYDVFIIHLNYNTSFRYKSIEMVDYDDYVYCVEVPNHTLLVKRNGHIQWCGNCRHILKPYTKGFKPTEIPANVIDKQREVDRTQRYLERGVRAWKERALLFKGIDNKRYIYSKNKAKEWNERYIGYSRDNQVAYYPSRTDII